MRKIIEDLLNVVEKLEKENARLRDLLGIHGECVTCKDRTYIVDGVVVGECPTCGRSGVRGGWQ